MITCFVYSLQFSGNFNENALEISNRTILMNRNNTQILYSFRLVTF